jgi:hypothetical protein
MAEQEIEASWPVAGLPETLHANNGPDLRSRAFGNGLPQSQHQDGLAASWEALLRGHTEAAGTIANRLAQILAVAGLNRVRADVGDSLSGPTTRCAAREKIEWFHVWHEEVGAFAAGAEAHLTNEVTVCERTADRAMAAGTCP